MSAGLRVSAIVLILALVGIFSPARAAGRWVAQSDAPTLRQQGLRYDSATLSPNNSTPLSGNAITRVAWRYDYAGWRPRELVVQLCGGGRCVDASSARGQTTAFAGLPVATPFRFNFRIQGPRAARTPLEGGALTLMVNFR